MNLTPEFLAVVDTTMNLVESLGMDHPETTRSLSLMMALAPKHLQDEMAAKARELGLMPKAHGYLEDGSPVFRIDDVAAQLDLSHAEVEEALREMAAEGDALGMSNAGTVTDAATIHRKQ